MRFSIWLTTWLVAYPWLYKWWVQHSLGENTKVTRIQMWIHVMSSRGFCDSSGLHEIRFELQIDPHILQYSQIHQLWVIMFIIRVISWQKITSMFFIFFTVYTLKNKKGKCTGNFLPGYYPIILRKFALTLKHFKIQLKHL